MFPFKKVGRKSRFYQALVICLSFWTINRILYYHDSILNRNELQSSIEDELLFPSANRASSNLNYHNTVVVANATANTTTNTIKESSYSNEYRHPNFTFDFPLCLVHVGKTAGSSISCGLGLMYADCEGMPRDPPLPHVHYFHMRKNTCHQEIATYLMTIRNPLTRIQSWFNFEKDIVPSRRNKQAEERLRWKRGMIFTECYDNFADLVTKGIGTMYHLNLHSTTTVSDNSNDTYKISSERPINMTCPERALAALLGAREFSYHEWYNYEHYWTALRNRHQKLSDGNNHSQLSALSPSLFVLRTEHLYEDWIGFAKEDLFRHVNKGSRNNSTTHVSKLTKDGDNIVSDNDYSSPFWVNLCYAMCPEIQIYKQILQHSNNLNLSQVQESISEVQMMCPEESSNIRSCPGIPRFPLLKVPRKEYIKETKQRLFAIK